ncbi:hypothetical protein [Novosphingobium panipatense]|uniref:Uncharacterized protein n=1 Tax=Novosphingobium panipatense TaxID=428991 RepID=A0ABY1Q3T3_9SPHN|nr:hypothetical protein [Novosphingobium panipatense]SMP58531.1 hypothetical protein SAMN06296065_102491 [Novosphingobium panipatense]
MEMLSDPKLSTSERLQILKALKDLEEPFWGVVRTLSGALAFAIVWIGAEVAGWIKRRS